MRLIAGMVIAIAVSILPARASALNGTWYTGSSSTTAGTPSISNPNSNDFTFGSGTLNGGSSALNSILWSYFGDESLAVDGDFVKVSFKVKWNNATVAGGGGFRFGLFDNHGSTVNQNLVNTAGDVAFSDSSGYFAFWDPRSGQSSTSSIKIRPVSSNNPNNPLSTGNATTTVNGDSANAMAQGVDYLVELQVKRLSASQYYVSTSFNGVSFGKSVFTITATKFNTFYLFNTAGYDIHSMTLSDLEITTNASPPPSSQIWYTGSSSATAGTPSISDPNSTSFTFGSGTLNGGSSALNAILWRYFDDETLAADDDFVKVSFDVRWNNATVASGSAFRLGLFDNHGSTVTQNLVDTTGDTAFIDSSGYFAMWDLRNGYSTGSKLKIRPSSSNNPINPLSTANATSSMSGPSADALAQGVDYPVEFLVKRLASNQYYVKTSFNGVSFGKSVFTIAATKFNTFYLFNTGGYDIHSMTFTNLEITTQDTPAGGPASPPIAGNWQLVFSDDFDGPGLDRTKWRAGSHYAGTPGIGNMQPENISVSGGTLKLKAEQRSNKLGGTTRSYATGEVTTFKEFRRKYGYFEARIKYPAIEGLWPAFWLMPDREEYGYNPNYWRSFIKFDMTSQSISQVNSAILRLKVSNFSPLQGSEGINMVVMKLVDDSLWDELSITWNNMPDPDPLWIANRFYKAGQIAIGDTIDIDVTDYVAQELSGDDIVTLVLADTYMQNKSIKFHSNDATTVGDRPKLIINGTTYNPSEDAYVRNGTSSSPHHTNNFGTAPILGSGDGYDATASTSNGGMEIDIMETLGIWGAGEIQHAAHWGGYGSNHPRREWQDITYPSSSDGFHTYGLYWEPDHMEFYIDGIKTVDWQNTRILDIHTYMLLTLQIGGWEGSAGPQVNNQEMEVDWVYVWSGTKTPDAPDQPLYVEAEDKDNTTGFSPFGIGTDANASGGEFIRVDSGNNSPNSMPNPGYADYSFDLDEELGVSVWLRARAGTTGSLAANDSFWLDMTTDQNSDLVRWNGVIDSTSWEWYRISTHILPAGTHNFRVGYREDGTLLDRLFFTVNGTEPN